MMAGTGRRMEPSVDMKHVACIDLTIRGKCYLYKPMIVSLNLINLARSSGFVNKSDSLL